ncbi:NADPH-dependent F420 reductase [Kordiimonas laminariae]|uniref:NADPH-dependent F420 reductase n=1 Tax=Kordiimonas laminariae TaxID=2917717 RepID=UPI001FF5B935|nr:NAD(P)-binding domain-containing protein [Kordiimonas laminariae]MCK0068148.1 NAD(P)-binding domain-containing protein [Kordiimonas laminariae]
MKIGIIGAGNVGSRLAALISAAGHEVVVGNRNGDTPIEAAVKHGDIIIVAIHYAATVDVLPKYAGQLEGKILVDATNPLNEDWSPMLLGETSSAAEETAKLVRGVKVVKAFNTIFADVMTAEHQNRNGNLTTAFVASDDQGAMEQVANLAASMGFAPVTINKLSAARYLEAVAHLNIELAVGQSGGTNAAFIYHCG